jgi:2-iminobutanoate/2-iminopropanoate deaminase
MNAITHINPAGLHTNPAFSQGVLCEAGRTLYIGGQNGTDATGSIVAGGMAEQTTRALQNVITVLAAAGAEPEHVVKMTIYLAADADLDAGVSATAATWGNHPTAISVIRVASIARPGALVEIDAVALVP